MNDGAGDELVDEAVARPPASQSTRDPRHSAARAVDEDLCRIQKADPEDSDIHTVFLRISKKITVAHEATTLGIILGCDPDDVDFYVTKYESDIRRAAYKFLRSTKDIYEPVKMWEKIIEGMEELKKNNTIKELGLQERLVAAKIAKHV